MIPVTLIVMAKMPVPGRVKTRLCPPCSEREASDIAWAALADTLEAVAATPVARRVLLLEGQPGQWLLPGFEVIDQRGDGLSERLAAATELLSPGTDSVLGPAHDGGWWALGLRRSDPRVFEGVPMRKPDTGARQRDKLGRIGLVVRALPTRRDVDDFDDVLAVAAMAAGTRFAIAVSRVTMSPSPPERP